MFLYPGSELRIRDPGVRSEHDPNIIHTEILYILPGKVDDITDTRKPKRTQADPADSEESSPRPYAIRQYVVPQ